MRRTAVTFFLIALMLAVTACGSKGKLPLAADISNEKMDTLTTQIKAGKKHDRALLLVSFGSTHDAPQKTFGAMKQAYASRFSDMDVYLAFTSGICIARCAEKGLRHYQPSQYLTALAAAGYTSVCVQSLHIIPGEEYQQVKNDIKDFHNNGGRPGSSVIMVNLGGPLLNTPADVRQMAQTLHAMCSSDVEAGRTVVFMGHGNAGDETYAEGNSRYTMLEEELHKISPRYYVGTVDMNGNLIADVIQRMRRGGISNGTPVICMPLMSTAGDHALNDMLGGTAPHAAEGSWRHALTEAGYTCPVENCRIIGLGDCPSVVEMWMNHTRQAIDSAASLQKKDKK